MNGAWRGSGLRRVNDHGNVEPRKKINQFCNVVVEFEDRHTSGLFALHHSRNSQTCIVVTAQVVSNTNHQRLHINSTDATDHPLFCFEVAGD